MTHHGYTEECSDICVHQLFEAQVERTPHAIALIDHGKHLTYQRLNQRANQLAHRLRAEGVAPETFVGLCCERSIDMIVALLAILKAGGAYVPLDPSYPTERIDFICRDAGLSLVLTQASLAGRLTNNARCLYIDDPSAYEPQETTNPHVESTPESALYALYTSGSTGQPKGVVTIHRSISSRILWADRVYPYQDGEVASARTPLGFVDSVAEIFAPLSLGVPLVLINTEEQRDPALMLNELRAKDATRIVLVPSLLGALLELYPDLGERLPRMRYWFVGGEPVPVPLVGAFKRLLPGRKLINIYGATEVSGDATYFDFDEMPEGLANSPIGGPLSGVYARVLDENLREVPDMETGEVCISGVCLARGYLNRPALTHEKFIPNPFPEGGKLYRTGDLGRRLVSGAIEYLGRMDQQVKIRGMRAELGEVESRLAELEGVSQAVAIAKEDERGQKSLVMFYTLAEPHSLKASQLRSYLERCLPDYMVPSFLVELETFPLNVNGKVDRRALRSQPIQPPARTSEDLPMSEEERRVAASWEAVLGCGPVGRSQSFFALGGNSLDAARIAVRLGEELGQKIPVASILKNPTVADLSSYLAEQRAFARRAPGSVAISGRVLPEVLPLSYHQFPFWFFYALTGDISVVSEAFGFDGEVDVERLQAAYSEAVSSFDILWMRFSRLQPTQRKSPRRPCRFLVSDRRDSTSPERDVLRQEADDNNSMPFTLESPPHIHGRLVLLPGGRHRLLVAVPHLAVDMASFELFRRALQQSYLRHYGSTDEPSASLLDQIEWERQSDRDEELKRDVGYWARLPQGSAWNAIPKRLSSTKLAGQQLRAFSERELPTELAERLTQYAQERAVSFPTILISALCASLSRVTQSDDVTLLMMLEKREQAETRGLFTTLASMMRFCLRGCLGAPLEVLVERTSAQLMESYDHTHSLMRKPTLFNHLWLDAPGPAVWLVRQLSARLADLWPEAKIDRELLADYLFAIVPYPHNLLRTMMEWALRKEPEHRDVIVTLNILPEVYQPEPRGEGGFRVLRARSVELLLRPGDLIINSDVLLDRTLQVYVSRNERGLLVFNLYGGGIDPGGLEEINEGILGALGELVCR